ncbi:NAD(P)-dependent oxidoreductase [Frigidibacter sp.]|uniref:NAD-dependent epimerase/dehydratase family protein n=1 Tax=Frigidibacter sp. TaxID=2586418 RepID=UPI002734D7EA|nr:NAD-dependent epimerase/dehydratase family protein [Frigidibacter sp.]MDP3338884.1 NAD-dependent epimerase/dehydratase family protein [Frigidibacter sp.]
MTGAAPRLAVLGAGGRVGTLLRASGGMPGVMWFSRRGGEGVRAWDLLADAPPQALQGAEVLICLAGAVQGAGLSDNRSLALAAAGAAAAAGIGHVLVASSIAVYGARGAPWREDARLRPRDAYGRAKVHMEAALLAHAARGGPKICLLRLGNVVGADAISAAIAGGQAIKLDRCPDGSSPRRSVIGPLTLARALLALAAQAQSGAGLPPILNLAQPGPMAMEALCAAAGRSFVWRVARPAPLPLAALDTGAVQALVPLAAADPAALIAEWRAAGGLP